MTKILSPEDAQKSLQGITIPPRPTILVDLQAILARPSADARDLVIRISRDVGIAAAVLKTVNSPLFALQSKCASVQQAVQMLGMKNVSSLVSGIALRQSVSGSSLSLERFWDTAERVAGLAARIASLLPRVPREEAYTFGLLRDIGIPVMMQRWPDYRDTLRMAAGDARPISDVEDERHGSNHAVLGFLLSRSWSLPDHVCEGIQRHHDRTVYRSDDSISPLALTLIAINRLAEHLHDSTSRMRTDGEWDLIGQHVLDHLGIDAHELSDLKEELSQ